METYTLIPLENILQFIHVSFIRCILGLQWRCPPCHAQRNILSYLSPSHQKIIISFPFSFLFEWKELRNITFKSYRKINFKSNLILSTLSVINLNTFQVILKPSDKFGGFLITTSSNLFRLN